MTNPSNRNLLFIMQIISKTFKIFRNNSGIQLSQDKGVIWGFTVSSHWKDQDSIKIGEYEKEYVNLQEWDYYDFGYGTLRYGRYEVTVPIEIEIWGEDYEDTMKVNVYYYTSNQNVSDGIDTSVEDHLYTPNIFEDPREGIWQDAD